MDPSIRRHRNNHTGEETGTDPEGRVGEERMGGRGCGGGQSRGGHDGAMEGPGEEEEESGRGEGRGGWVVDRGKGTSPAEVAGQCDLLLVMEFLLLFSSEG